MKTTLSPSNRLFKQINRFFFEFTYVNFNRNGIVSDFFEYIVIVYEISSNLLTSVSTYTDFFQKIWIIMTSYRKG